MHSFSAKILVCLVALAPMLGLSSSAQAQDAFASCQLQDRANDTIDGRFIFKKSGNHFPGNGVVVVPRCYYNGSRGGSPVRVELYTGDGSVKLERASLKSTGNCAGNSECFFASSFLTRRNGAFYKRRYGSIRVRIAPLAGVTNLRCNYCSYYQINDPSKRAAFRPPVVVKPSR